MTHHYEVVATDRLRRALLAFQTARNRHLSAHRRLKALPQAEVEAFWDGPGRRVGETMHAAATEVVAAFEVLPRAGLVIDMNDRRLVAQAQRYLAEGAA
jgi:hypothetical protein